MYEDTDVLEFFFLYYMYEDTDVLEFFFILHVRGH